MNYTVYAIRRDHRVKLGRSVNPFERLKSIQTGCPDPLRVELIIDDLSRRQSVIVEHHLHLLFYDRRVLGEWFEVTSAEVADTFEKIAHEFNTRVATEADFSATPIAHREEMECCGDGDRIYMRLAEPGVYRDADGEIVSQQRARAAGFDTLYWGVKARVKLAMQVIEKHLGG